MNSLVDTNTRKFTSPEARVHEHGHCEHFDTGCMWDHR